MKKPPILLISGWAHGAEAMYPLADAMGDSQPVTSLSLAELLMQGNGEDQNGPADGAISAYARAISCHLDKSGEPACIVGWSTGGIAAIDAAAGKPEKVAGLVLLSATARFCSESNVAEKELSGGRIHLGCRSGRFAGNDPKAEKKP